MGGFALGSTVVMVFEAPEDFVFCIKRGEKVKVGEALGDRRTKIGDLLQEQKVKEMLS